MSETIRPSVCRLVHYVSYGTPGGEYHSRCRAAVIAEVGQWITVETTKPASYDRSEGRPIRVLEQWWYDDACALAVFNPTGVFFNGAASVACRHDEGVESEGERVYQPGTWHWPERV